MFIICKRNSIWLQISTAALLVSTGLYIRRYRASWAYGFGKAHGHQPSRKGFELRGWAESRGLCTCPVLLTAAGQCHPREGQEHLQHGGAALLVERVDFVLL